MTVPNQIDINADLGESFGVYRYGADEEVLPLITSANVAAGFHASDPLTLHNSVQAALDRGIRIGAHVGYPDRLGFGRRSMQISADDAYAYTVYQIGAVDAFARAGKGSLHHVKLHGAMYMDACESIVLAEAVARAIKACDPYLTVYTLPGSDMETAASDAGLTVWREYFADRPYEGGQVTMFGWTMEELGSADQMAARASARLAAPDAPSIETICVHSDTPGAPEILSAVRRVMMPTQAQ